ncbi:MAG TPA: hypothetical protein PK530_22655 [Anaerolineales bacterium]|nr:hypothetical protein [Anaerolineales bacterium]
MYPVKKFSDQIPFGKLVAILILIGSIQFAIINLKVWRPHPAAQPLHEFILGSWVANNLQATDAIGTPLKIDFIDSNDVYFEREFPDLYEKMQRDYQLNGNTVELTPSARLLFNWTISRNEEALAIGDVNYHRVINFPWRIIAIILFVCVIWGIKLMPQIQRSNQIIAGGPSNHQLHPKWKTFVGLALILTLTWLGLKIGVGGYALTRTPHWREPWLSLYTLEILLLLGTLPVRVLNANWKRGVSEMINPWVSMGYLVFVSIATSIFWFSIWLFVWVTLGN